MVTAPDGIVRAPAALYLLTSVARASHAVAMVRMSAMVLFCFDRCMAVSRFGMAMAARMPMIATTISSSMRVKPFCFLDMKILLEDSLIRKRHTGSRRDVKPLTDNDLPSEMCAPSHP